MTRVRVIGVAVVIAVCAAPGCHSTRSKMRTSKCREPEGYVTAQTIPPLKIPAGLQAPDTHNALRIPDLKEPPPPRRKPGEPCLDEPPPFLTPKATRPEA